MSKEIKDEEFSVELTDEEKKKIEEETRKEVQKQLKDSKKKAFKEQAMRQAKATALFSSATDEDGDDIVEVWLELASYPKYVMLDGKIYHDSNRIKRAHRVSKRVAQVLLDQMHRGWMQEEAVHPSEPGQIKKFNRDFRMNSQGVLRQVA